MFADNFNPRAKTGEVQRIAFAAASALSIRIDTDDVLLAPRAYRRFMVSPRQPEAAKAATCREHDKPDAKRIYKCICRDIQRRYLRDRRSALRGPRRHADTPPPHFGADPLVEPGDHGGRTTSAGGSPRRSAFERQETLGVTGRTSTSADTAPRSLD